MGQIIEDAKFKEEFLTGILHQQLDDRASAWDSFVDAIEDKISDSADTIEDSQKKIFDIQREIAGFNFEGSIKGADDLKKSAAANARSSKLVRDAARSLRGGDVDVATQYLDDAKAMAKLALSSAEAAENAGAEHQARKQVLAVFHAQKKQQEQIIANTRIQTQLATSVFGETKSRAERINKIIEDMKTIEIYGPKGKKLLNEEQAKAEFKRLAGALQFELDQAKIGKNLFDRIGLQEVFTEATKLFEDLLTKEPVSLKFTIDQYIDELYGDLRDYAKKNPIPWPVVQAAEALGADITNEAGLDAAQQLFTGQAKDLRASKRGLLDTTEAQKGYADAISNSAQISSTFFQRSIKLQKNLQQAIETTERMKFSTTKGSKERASQETFIAKWMKEIATLKSITSNTRDAFANLTRGTENLDTERLTGANTQLKIYHDALIAIGRVDLAEGIFNYVTEMKKAVDLVPEIKLGESVGKDVQGVEGKVKAFHDAIGPGTSDAAAVGAQGVSRAATSMVSSAERAEIAWRKVGLAMGSASGTPVLAHFGSLIYRASGGDARGTDTVPAMLSPGEFVMNASSTKRFYSQLVAMNAGKSPTYRERGGPVTNVGDVNITVSGATAPVQTARETMKAFRREMRRHTATF
ncbi:hypothetical protein LCGC14_0927200 [marine sediment metagenome]|uniref:Bacteriophage tail tape measure C-terminal domain-containing protein n=1 Tax=marine sediment metagenome TaxID=412755 RepID=A0A0F9RVT0_9ZZZZ